VRQTARTGQGTRRDSQTDLQPAQSGHLPESGGRGTAGDPSSGFAVREHRVPGSIPLYRHPVWTEMFPWLIQGTTARGDDAPFDLRLAGNSPIGEVLGRWQTLRSELDCARAVYARQVHGSTVLAHSAGPAGMFIADSCDGHATNAEGILLAVSVADCVPVSLVDPTHRAIAMVHAGWRGVAAGVLESGITALSDLAGSNPAELFIHLGPAICGQCYEVGPEVHRALGLPEPDRPTPVDLRVVLGQRAVARGVSGFRITTSAFCTRCDHSPFFSHRAGHRERQVAVLAIRRSSSSSILT
jgi:YfiH family protein